MWPLNRHFQLCRRGSNDATFVREDLARSFEAEPTLTIGDACPILKIKRHWTLPE